MIDLSVNEHGLEARMKIRGQMMTATEIEATLGRAETSTRRRLLLILLAVFVGQTIFAIAVKLGLIW